MTFLKETELGNIGLERIQRCRGLIADAKLNPDLSEGDITTLTSVDQQCLMLVDVLQNAQAETVEELSRFDETLAQISEFCDAVEKDVRPLAEGVAV